jgi:hypothetical protein
LILCIILINAFLLDENASANEVKENEDTAVEEEDDVDELMGYHFLGCTTLFVAYVYVNSGLIFLYSFFPFVILVFIVLANKVFEDRLINKGLVAEFRDFEAVYHLVIDAVDTYNEKWEQTFRDLQQQQQVCLLFIVPFLVFHLFPILFS